MGNVMTLQSDLQSVLEIADVDGGSKLCIQAAALLEESSVRLARGSKRMIEADVSSHRSTKDGVYTPHQRIRDLSHVRYLPDEAKALACRVCKHKIMSPWFFLLPKRGALRFGPHERPRHLRAQLSASRLRCLWRSGRV